MKRLLLAALTAILMTTPTLAETIETSTGLIIPVYPDWTQETVNGSTQLKPAYGGGFFQITDKALDSLDDEHRDYAYFLCEMNDVNTDGYKIANIRNDKLFGIGCAYEDLIITTNGISYAQRLFFVNNGGLTTVTYVCDVGKMDQYENEFNMWIDSFQFKE